MSPNPSPLKSPIALAKGLDATLSGLCEAVASKPEARAELTVKVFVTETG